MRCSVLLLAACGSGPVTQDEPPPIAAPAPRELAPITGAHGGAITLLAVTADGLAAITADATGGLRLWPTLDGTREPIVVHGPAATALAIGRDGSGFAVAITDAADHAELLRIDASGRVRARHRLGEAQQLAIAGAHVLALRAAQVIDQLAFDGTLRAQLPAEAGTRVAALLVHDTHAAALVESERARHVTQLELAPLAWGTRSPALALADDPGAVLGPNAASLLALARDGRIERFDLATGKHQAACPASQLGRMGSHDFGGLLANEGPIGVVGDRVACFVDGAFSFYTPASGTAQTANLGGGAPDAMVAAGDRVVIANEHQLVIATPDRTQYLGYGFRDLTHVRAVPTGLVIGKGDQEPVVLDDDFHERTRFALPKLRVAWTDLVPADDRFLITSSTRPGSGDLWGSAYQIAIYDAAKQVMHQVLPYRARSGELVYEPATRLLVITDGGRTALARLDPATHALVDETTLALADPPKHVALLDPALADGMIALAVREEGAGGLVISELHAQDLPAQPDGERAMRAAASYRITGTLAAIDRAGRVYVHNLLHADGIGVYEHGVSKATLVGAQAATLRPSPDGEHVVAMDGGRLALYTTTGKQRWQTAAWGASDVGWTPSGVLFARFPHALVRIELETGRLVERQCGWAFGISATPRVASSAAPSVCDVAP